MQTAQVEAQRTEFVSQPWAGTMTVGNVAHICEQLGSLLIGKEVTIVTANEVHGYKPEVYPKQKLYAFDSGHSFEIRRECFSTELLIAIEPIFMVLQFSATQLFSDGTFQCPHNPRFEFNKNHVTITWFSKTKARCFKNFIVLSV